MESWDSAPSRNENNRRRDALCFQTQSKMKAVLQTLCDRVNDMKAYLEESKEADEGQ